MAPKRRRVLFVDRKLQGALLAHTTLYWFYCLVSISLFAAAWITLCTKPTSPGDLLNQLWLYCAPVFLGSLVLLPLVLMDCLRLSNRLAGPMVRIQRVMAQLANGEKPHPVNLREKDFWQEFSLHLNEVISKMDEAGLCGPPAELPVEPPADTAEPAPELEEQQAM